MLLRPPSLKKGDTIYILSTARKITLEEITPSIKVFESWGLKVLVGKTIGKEDHQYAGTDKERREDFQFALDAPEIRAIVCARGGYGTVRIMDSIIYDGFMGNNTTVGTPYVGPIYDTIAVDSQKWVVGFSDVTYLHTDISNNLGVQCIHSIMPVQFPKSTPEAIETLRRELFGESNEYAIEPHPLNRHGQANGILIGGNLSILYSITGTRSGMNTFGKILFLEDIDEYLYHIDRMMMNLKRSGKLHDLAGMVVGGFSDMKDNKVPFGKDAYAIIAEHVAEFKYPVCFDFPAGHIPDSRALVIGKTYSLSVNEKSVQLK